MLGREFEISVLDASIREARTGRVVTAVVSGPAGAGKSELVRTFAERVGSAALVVSGAVDGRWHDYGLVDRLLARMGLPARATYRDPSEAAQRLVDVINRAVGVTVIVIDDAHWADHASQEALGQALGHLRGQPVLVVAVTRTDEALDVIGERPRPPAELLHPMVGGLGHVEVDIEGLGEEAIEQLLAGLGVTDLGKGDLAHIRARTDGNPLLITRLATRQLDALRAHAPEADNEPEWAHSAFDRSIRADLAAIGPAGERLLATAAVLGPAPNGGRTLDDIANAAGLAIGEAHRALDAARRSGLVDVVARPTRLTFTHALVREAVYRDIDTATRRSLHLAAADVATSDEARLRHLAMAATGVDEALAAGLAAQAARQAAECRWAAASSLLEIAADLTPDRTTRDRRAALAVEHLFTGGDSQTAVQRTEAVAPTLAAGPWQDYLVGRAALQSGQREQAARLLGGASRALAEQGDDIPAARAAALVAAVHVNAARPTPGADAARRSMTLAAGTSLEQAQCMLALALAQEGRYDNAASEIPDYPNDRSGLRPERVDAAWSRGVLALWTDRIADAEAHLHAVMEFTRHRGPFQAYITTVMYRAEAAYRAGEWAMATDLSNLAAGLADDRGHRWVQALTHSIAALPLAGRGDWEAASHHVDAALSYAKREADLASILWARTAAAHLAASQSDPDAVTAACAPFRHLPQPGAHQPGIQPWRQVDLTALVQLEAWDEARASLRHLTDAADHTRHATAQLDAARIALALTAATDNAPPPNPALVTQRANHPGVWPLHRGLAWLELGRFHDRTGDAQAARQELTKARAEFAALGAEPYVLMVDKAEADLNATSASTVDRALTQAGLTRKERQAVHLVTRGHTTARVARDLGVTPKTVESHLTRAYAKLGISGHNAGRTQLTAAIARLLHDRGHTRPSHEGLPAAHDQHNGSNPERTAS